MPEVRAVGIGVGQGPQDTGSSRHRVRPAPRGAPEG
jgi:hypothetical protein